MSDIERRFRKEIRNKLPQKGPLPLRPTGTREAFVTEQLLTHIFNGRRKVVWSETGFTATTLEQELARQLAMLLEEEPHEWPPILLESVPEELIAQYAERHGIDAPPAEERYPRIRQLIEELQERQAQTKPALRKSFGALREKLKKQQETNSA